MRDVCLACKLKTKEATAIIKRARDAWGDADELVLVMEELAELIVEISRALRGREHKITEELADVYIVLRSLEVIFDNTEACGKIVDEKLERLRQRIEQAACGKDN